MVFVRLDFEADKPGMNAELRVIKYIINWTVTKINSFLKTGTELPM